MPPVPVTSSMHELKFKVSRTRFALTPIAFVACALLHAGGARAQAQPATPAAVPLKPSPALRPDIPAAMRDQLPTFVTGDRISGRTDLETVIEGDAQLRRGDTVIRADRIEYY